MLFTIFINLFSCENKKTGVRAEPFESNVAFNLKWEKI